MKALVVFYSRTGNTKKAGEEIAENLKANLDEIIDKKDRTGITGWLGGGRDALFNHETKIEKTKDPLDYGLVIIGTPVWAGTVTPAVRVYLADHKFKKIAFFCTCSNSKGKTFEDMQKLSKKPISVLEVKAGEIGTKKAKDKIKKFCQELAEAKK
jgi:flavodoxin